MFLGSLAQIFMMATATCPLRSSGCVWAGSWAIYLRTRKRRLVTWPDRVTSVGSRRIAWGAAGQWGRGRRRRAG
jgi:hypothetical protein